MRPDSRPPPRRAPVLVGVLLSALTGAALPASAGPPGAKDGTPCPRSVRGDVESARRHVDRGRIDLAAIYLDGLSGCPEAWLDPSYLLLRLDVKEELGELNLAWSAGYAGLRLAEQQAAAAPARGAAASIPVPDLRRRLLTFAARHTFIRAPVAGEGRPAVRYLGPFADGVTIRLLGELAGGLPVLVGDLLGEPDLAGFWLLPGRYEVNGEALDLAPGGRWPPGPRPVPTPAPSPPVAPAPALVAPSSEP